VKHLLVGCLFGCFVLIAVADPARASVSLAFPSASSSFSCPPASGCFLSGAFATETFVSTGLSPTNHSEWIFSIADHTTSGVHSTFEALINGFVVGTFSFDGGVSLSHDFDLVFDYAPIAGDTFTLELLATSTVPVAHGTWDWKTGGAVTLSNLAVPQPANLVLFGTALAAVLLLRAGRRTIGAVSGQSCTRTQPCDPPTSL
jgi:hypothetical protein